MTQPANIIPPPPVTEAAQFTQAAIDQALTPPRPPPIVETPPQPGEEPAVEPVAAPAPVVAAPGSKLAEAEAKAAALVAKRRAKSQARADQDARARGLEAQLASERAAREAAEAQARRVETDTLGVMREKGITERMLTQAAIDESTPEGRAAKAEATAAALAQRLDAYERQERQKQQTAHVTAVRRAYLEAGQALDGDAPRYPHLAAHAAVDPEAVVAHAERIAAKARAQGKIPTDADLHEYQEWLYAQAAAKVKPPAAAETHTATTTHAAPPAAKPAARGARTLSGRTTQPASLAKTFDQMTPSEQLAVMAAQLKAQTPAT
jgi:hypothetical protein